MDLVDYSSDTFEEVVTEYKKLASKLEVRDIHFIPISALNGDNVVEQSKHMPWYKGPTLLYLLENIHISSDLNHIDCRLPVQYVVRPRSDEFHDFRGYAGRIAGGIFKPGDKVVVLPSGFTSSIKTIETFEGVVAEAFPSMSVTVTLEDDVDVSRGDMIVRENNQPDNSQDIDLMVCWLHDKKLEPGGKYAIKHTTRDARCVVKEVKYKVDINSLHRNEQDKEVNMNDIARIQIRTTQPLLYDSYRKNRITGSLIMVDEHTNETVGAGMII
jgi:sulfate adenylyltransferase subunit 1